MDLRLSSGSGELAHAAPSTAAAAVLPTTSSPRQRVAMSNSSPRSRSRGFAEVFSGDDDGDVTNEYEAHLAELEAVERVRTRA